MGRTSRERRRRKESYSRSLVTNETKIISDMENWMFSLDWFPTCELKPHVFPLTGRGLMCLDDIKIDDVLVKIPKKLLITTSTLRDSKILEIFQNSMTYETQCVLAVFLVYEKHLKENSRWKSYLDSLPSFYTVPDFCSAREKKLLSFISQELKASSDKVLNNYCSVVESINILEKSSGHLCAHCGESLHDIFTFNAFKWAYYTVNTRAVYIDNTRTVNTHIRIKDADNMALAPFLDLFNHSYDAAVRVGQVFDTENREYYQIKTLQPFVEGSQVFINYGSHDSRKLYAEYGFFIPNNPLDRVPFDFSHIKKFSSVPRSSYDFIRSHNFHENMGFTSEGLTYNAKIVLFLLSTRSTMDEREKKLYNEEFSSQDLLAINSLGKKILDDRISELVERFSMMEEFVGGTESFKIATALVKEYINLLNRSLEHLNIDIDHSPT